MKKLFWLVIGVIIVYSACIQRNNLEQIPIVKVRIPEIKNPETKKHTVAWEKIQSKIILNHKKSALSLLDSILTVARENKNQNQILKCHVFKSGLIDNYKKNKYQDLIDGLNKDLKAATFPFKQILNSYIAETYWNYYNQNRWRISRRSETLTVDSNDILTWDLNSIIKIVHNHYKASLTSKDSLWAIPITEIKDVITNDEYFYRQPKLYDFLANRALAFYANSEANLAVINEQFKIDKVEFFTNLVNTPIQSIDTLNTKFLSLKIYQELQGYHKDDEYPAAFLVAKMNSLKYCNENTEILKHDSLCIAQIKELFEDCKLEDLRSVIAYNLTVLYFESKQLVEAEEWCKIVLDLNVESQELNEAKVIYKKIHSKMLAFNVSKNVLPNQVNKILITHTNVDSLHFRLCPIDNWKYIKKTNTWQNKSDFKSNLKKLKPSNEWIVNLSPIEDFKQHKVEVELPPLKHGGYVLIASVNEDFGVDSNAISYAYIQVTNLSIVKKMTKDAFEILVLNRETGDPLSGVVCNLKCFKNSYNSRFKVLKSYQETTNSEGKVLFNKISSNYRLDYYLSAKLNSNVTWEMENKYFYESSIKDKNVLKLFTDRSIYRPGQTIHFKGLMFSSQKKKIYPDYQTEVTLFDVNRKKVKTLKVKTNKFGTFSGSFKLPSGSLNGSMFIGSKDDYHYFRVEEYKRPKFEVVFKPIKTSFRLNDSIKLKGEAKAFSGAKIGDAKVSYKIVRQKFTPYRNYYRSVSNSVSKQIDAGTTLTNSDGSFTIPFKAIPSENDLGNDKATFNYTVTADVTDISGETHSVTKTIKVGYASLSIELIVSSNINVLKPKPFKVFVKNMAGESISTKVNLRIVKLEEPKRLLKDRLWDNPDSYILSKSEHNKIFLNDLYNDENDITTFKESLIVASFKLETGKTNLLNISNIKSWKNGRYKVIATAIDENGLEVEEITYLTVFNPKVETAPINTYAWFYLDKTTTKVGEEVTLYFSSASKKATVFYELEKKGKVLLAEKVVLSNQLHQIKIKITESMLGGVNLKVFMVKNNRIHSFSSGISVPYHHKKLDVSFSTFRSKLYPGQKERWTVKIKGSDGEKVSAELLAGMYDASLDEFVTNNWSLDLYGSSVQAKGWELNYGFSQQNGNSLNNLAFWYNKNSSFDGLRFKTKSLLSNEGKGVYNFSHDLNMNYNYEDEDDLNKRRDYRKSENIGFLDEESHSSANSMFRSDKVQVITDSVKNSNVNLKKVIPRTNFNETAFFYPHLKTDQDGSVNISFTIPESLTKWKFMALAHTKDLKVGKLVAEVFTQKDLMIELNAPRFFREGDEMILSAKIANISDSIIKGFAQLKFINPITQKEVLGVIVSEKEVGFSCLGKQNKAVKWEVIIPEGIGALTYVVTVRSKSFSDGEEKIIPVLSNRMLVTASLPLSIRGNEIKKFRFDKLINNKSTTLKHHKLTLEFSSNPAWYAIQSLPYMMEYPYECSEQTFTRFYANAIAFQIANSSPKIKSVFDSWKAKSPDSFLSNLEKNQELKSVLLKETPWVLDAKNESERKKRIGLLFDFNKMSNEKSKNLAQLIKKQNSDGSWSWFPGMRSSRYITQHIVTGFGKLKKMGVTEISNNSKIDNLIQKAIRYLDKQIIKDHEEAINKSDKDVYIYDLRDNIQYLYARSFFPSLKMNKKTKLAHDYYLNKCKIDWQKQVNQTKAMIAIVMNRKEYQDQAKSIMASLKDNATQSDEMGMYWEVNYAGYYWYEAPIETQAMMIEAFDEVLNDTESVEELKIWLLKSKQTQNWKTTKATSAACYALLMNGADILSSDQLAEIKIGGKLVSSSSIYLDAQAGTGYIKKSWSGSEVKNEMGNVKINKSNKGIAWGAIYWQYFEQMDKITPNKSPLSIKKELLKEVLTSGSKKLVPIENEQLKVGDKVIVRIVLKSDRDMEYVHLKDMRAASFEPINVLSRYKYQDGLGYYESTGDAATNFFMDRVRKGTYVFEYPLRVSIKGSYSNGISSVQCMYAPEFTANSKGLNIKVE